MKIFFRLSGLFLVSASLFWGTRCLAVEKTFNPNYLADDSDILNYTSMTAAEIQNFLLAKGGFLATYTCQDIDGQTMSAAQAIYQVSITNRVNPRFLLVLLQKEQSLITDQNPKIGQLDWATGYGCPDGGGCNERWRGFYKQINSASLQFRDYLENPRLYKYQTGQTYVFTNPYGAVSNEPMTVTPINKATAALYNYTPHVYNGNYNFWKFWNSYFQSSGYPDGTLLQARGEPGVWLIQDGKKRPFYTRGALISRFDPKKIIPVNKNDLNQYPVGAPIKFPQYAILRGPDKKLYLLVDDAKRLFDSAEAFKKIGYNPEEIIDAGADELASYRDAQPITLNDVYPTGALLKNKTTGEIFWVEAGTKAPIVDPIFLSVKFKNKKPIVVDVATLNKYQTVAPVRFASGELVRLNGGFMNYVVEGITLRPIASNDDFDKLGYKWSNIITISPQVMLLYSFGDQLNASDALAATSTPQ